MTAVQRLQQEMPEREQSTVEKFRMVALQFDMITQLESSLS